VRTLQGNRVRACHQKSTRSLNEFSCASFPRIVVHLSPRKSFPWSRESPRTFSSHNGLIVNRASSRHPWAPKTCSLIYNGIYIYIYIYIYICISEYGCSIIAMEEINAAPVRSGLFNRWLKSISHVHASVRDDFSPCTCFGFSPSQMRSSVILWKSHGKFFEWESTRIDFRIQRDGKGRKEERTYSLRNVSFRSGSAVSGHKNLQIQISFHSRSN